MANGVPSIEIAEPGGLFKDLGSTILKGIISDAFYQARSDRVKASTTLWDAYKLDAEMALKLTNPDQVEDSINRLELAISNPETPQNLIPSLEGAMGSLEQHFNRLQDAMPGMDISAVEDGFEDIYKESTQQNSAQSVDPDFLKGVIDSYKEDENRLINEHIQKDELESINKIQSQFDESNQIFKDSYLDESGQFKEDMTDEELLNMGIHSKELRDLADSIGGVYNTMESAQQNPVAYLRDVKNDKLAAHSLNVLQGQIRVLEQQKKKADSLKTWNTAVKDYNRKLDDARSNPEEYGKLSQELLIELNDIATTHSQFLDQTALNFIDDRHDEARVISSALNVINRTDKHLKDFGTDAGYQSETAKDFLESAHAEAVRGYTLEDKNAISNAISNLNRAITEERSYHTRKAQGIKQDKTDAEKGYQSRIDSITSKISEDFGTGTKSIDTKAKYDSDYLEGGDFELTQNPKSILKGLKLDDRRNVLEKKVLAGEDLARLVKSSDLPSDNEEVNKLVNIALNVNEDTLDRARALDELFVNHLKNKSTDLDFEGFGDKDSSAQILYSRWLEVYGILHEAEFTSAAKWGEDFGQKYVSEYGHGTATDPLTGEPVINLNK